MNLGLDDGRILDLVFKSRAAAGPAGRPRSVKPVFVLNERREFDIYRHVLSPEEISSPIFYGGDPERSWLFLEKVSGFELVQVGEFGTWQAVARWLGRFHDQYGGRAEELVHHIPLLRHDAVLYRRWPRRARANLRSHPPAVRRRFEVIVDRFDRVVDRLLAEPTTLLHGDFYPSNVIIEEKPSGPVVRPIDWDLAGIGPGVYDLAALVAGRWTEAERRALAEAFRDGGRDDSFFELLNHARLLVAVQWLGWAAGWTPPTDHAHDWLTEAFDLAERLAL
jgi:Ser/Thr protein kinase RdoA (MazF antagonist)